MVNVVAVGTASDSLSYLTSAEHKIVGHGVGIVAAEEPARSRMVRVGDCPRPSVGPDWRLPSGGLLNENGPRRLDLAVRRPTYAWRPARFGPLAVEHKKERMKHLTNKASGSRQASHRLTVVAGDVLNGFMSTSRFVVTAVGCVTLLSAAAIVSNESARLRFVELAPTVVGDWVTQSTPAMAEAAQPDDGAKRKVALRPDLELEQRNVTQYLSRRYRVADEAVRVLVAAAYRAGEELALDPLLILAVMAVESSMNPFAESAVGAQGLMQVMTRVHAEKFEMHGGDHAALDPVANIKVGSAILKDVVRRGGSIERGLQLYVGAGNLPDDGGYGSRVMAEKSRIQLAANGKVDGALNAGLRADSAKVAARSVPAPEAALISPPSPASAPVQTRVATDKAA